MIAAKAKCHTPGPWEVLVTSRGMTYIEAKDDTVCRVLVAKAKGE